MNPVTELQRRTQRAGLGNPVYQSVPLAVGHASCVFVGEHAFSVFHHRSVKQGRRIAASCALFELFSFCRAIVVSDKDPQIELVRWLPPSCLRDPKHLAVLFDTKCPIYVVGDGDFPESARVVRLPDLGPDSIDFLSFAH